MNVAYFLIPKSQVGCIGDDNTVRQGLEKLKRSGYSALPVVTRENRYVGTVSEGDFLWHLEKTGAAPDVLEKHKIRDILREGWNPAARIDVTIEALLEQALTQNFVPMVDDRNLFIGIITRQEIMRYILEKQKEL